MNIVLFGYTGWLKNEILSSWLMLIGKFTKKKYGGGSNRWIEHDLEDLNPTCLSRL